jgi:hypothetical protein
MKKTKILYWIFTILTALLITFSSIPNIMVDEASVQLIHGALGYPEYIIRFLGIAKMLAVIIILIPGFPRLKEWAYAGLVFDLTGAVYSLCAIGTPISQSWGMLIFIVPIALSYIYHHKKLKDESIAVV